KSAMTDNAGYLLSPQQARVIDGLARRERDRPGEASEIATGVCRGGAFRIQIVIRPKQRFEGPELAARVRDAIERHQILRLRLMPHAGGRRPLQTFVSKTPQDPVAEGICVVSGAPVADVCQAEWDRPFDLTQEAPFRVVLVRDGEGGRLVLTAAAVALDARAALDLTVALCDAEHVEQRDPDALSWLDASAFFLEWIEDDSDEDAKADRDHFAGIEGAPTTWPRRVAVASENDARGFVTVRVPLAREVVRTLAAVAQKADAAEEVFWLAALKAFFARTSAVDNPLVRLGSEGRDMEEVEAVLGPFSRWLPAAIDVSASASVHDVAVSLQPVVDVAKEHETGHCEPDPKTAKDPAVARAELDAVALAYAETELGAAGHVESLRAVDVDAPIIARLVTAQDQPEVVTLTLEVDADQIDTDAASHLAASLSTWLTAVARAPDTPLRALPLLADGEACDRALGAPYVRPTSPTTSFLKRFEAAAIANPERIAIRSDAGTLTYRVLEQRTRSLANRLRAASAGQAEPVAIVMSRTHHAVVAMLAAMRAGAPYLPLDPQLPTDAVSFRLRDAKVAVVLTETALLERLPNDAPRWTVDDDIAVDDAAPAPGAVTAKAVAYLLYTSGSTGAPKAVAVEHQQLDAYIDAVERAIDVGPGACWGNISTLAADVGHTVIFPALASGGTLRLLGEEAMGNARVLAQSLRAFPVDVLKIVPSHLTALLDSVGAEGASALLPRRALLCGGEAFGRDLVDRVQGTVPKVFNHYGPTETTVGVAVGDARSAPRDAEGAVPIGHPLGFARLYVLDDALAPVPVGMIGELFIAGPTVTRGYHGRAALTAERYLPDPYGPEPGARMYRTGDRMRRLADGALVFHGRKDFQVKIRGFRVEPGEVEAVIGGHPYVGQVAVKAVADTTSGALKLAAWVAPNSGVQLDAADLREWVKSRLSIHMMPSAWVIQRALPLTANGKIDRAALVLDQSPRTSDRAPIPPRGHAEREIAAMWCELLQRDQVGVEDNFFDLGGHSLLLVQLMSKLETRFEREIRITDLFQYPTVAAMARWLGEADADALPAQDNASRPSSKGAYDDAIAVVGMSARLPEAPSIDAFWQNLRAGRDGVRRLARDDLTAAGIDASVLDDPHFVPAGPVLDDIDRFDAAFFGIPPRQAQIMDPQHRLLIESAWSALEDAGLAPGRSAGRIGVFAGAGVGRYFLQNLATSPELLTNVGLTAVRHANRVDNLATRVAYHLDLSGPAVTVQSGCSSSLVAVHLAAQSLRAGDADVALAGGVTVNPGQGRGYHYQPGGINAPDGRCRAFDAAAAGTVFGSGVGVVVLKRLADAVADGHTIHAVVLGSAMNNDGAEKPGYAAPSIEGQATVVAEALARAGVNPADIDFVEAHGTGTLIGDPVEVAALTRAFGGDNGPRGTCALGSVKSSIGHLDAAAGIAGFLKAVLALRHGEIPPTLHFETPNPRFDLEKTPFRIAAERQSIVGAPEDRRAGVSSFGIGGTNVHVVLGGPPSVVSNERANEATQGDGATMLALSARSEAALDRMTAALARHLTDQPELPLDDVAWTLASGRRTESYRRTIVCSNRDEAIRSLTDPQRTYHLSASARATGVAFLFPGQGSQFPGMAAQLYATDAAFRPAFDAALSAIEAALVRMGRPVHGELRQLLLDSTVPDGRARLADTRYAQPALFVVETALATALMNRGLRPVVMLGHSLGELVAATQAGVFSLEDAATLVVQRAALVAAQPSGAMLAVRAPIADVTRRLASPEGQGVVVCAINGASDVTVGGASKAVDTFAAYLGREDVPHLRLTTSHAFHTPIMQGAVEPFVEALRKVARKPPTLPFVSVRTGTWIRQEEAVRPEHWAAHLVEPVRFADAWTTLAERFDGVAVEVGPGRSLASLVRKDARISVVASLSATRRVERPVTTVLADLWRHGAALDWSVALRGGRGRRISLPSYPFATSRHWVGPKPGSAVQQSSSIRLLAGFDSVDKADSAPTVSKDAAERGRKTLYVEPTNDIERNLVDIWQQLLGVPDVGIHDDFFELGGDSIQGLRMLTLAREAGYTLQPTDLFQNQTVATLAEVVRSKGLVALGQDEDAATPLEAAGFRSTPRRIIPMTIEQRRWLNAGGAPVHVVRLAPTDAETVIPSEDALKAATVECTARHGVLRLRAGRVGGEWMQRLVDLPRASWRVVSHDVPPEGAAEPVLTELASELDPVMGPVAAAARLMGKGGGQLAVLIHPVVVDAYSLQTIIDDLLSLSLGGELESSTADPQAHRFAEHAESSLLAAFDADAQRHPLRAPRDHALGEARARDRSQVVRSVSGDIDQATIVAATSGADGQWMGQQRVVLSIEADGRTRPGSVGAFTDYIPAVFDLVQGQVTTEMARAVLQKMTEMPVRHAYTERGEHPDIVVRVRGVPRVRPTAGFRMLPLPAVVPWTSQDARRPHLVEIELRMGSDQTPSLLSIEYSTTVHRSETIERFAGQIMANLAGDEAVDPLSGSSPSLEAIPTSHRSVDTVQQDAPANVSATTLG
ncbi:MAG: amino acid adenylation domain-containing protein, partial [Myxococcota bacterium]